VRLPLGYGHSARWWLNVTCAGIAVAVAFAVLAAAAAAPASVRITGDVPGTGAERSYDLIVRGPAQAGSGGTEGWVTSPASLPTYSGGITLAQYDAIRRLPGVAVAAPMTMVGYLPLTVGVPIDLPASAIGSVPRPATLTVRLRSDNGLSAVTWDDVTMAYPGRLPGMMSVQLSWTFLLPLIAVDPAAEARLLRLDAAVVSGSFLPTTTAAHSGPVPHARGRLDRRRRGGRRQRRYARRPGGHRRARPHGGHRLRQTRRRRHGVGGLAGRGHDRATTPAPALLPVAVIALAGAALSLELAVRWAFRGAVQSWAGRSISWQGTLVDIAAVLVIVTMATVTAADLDSESLPERAAEARTLRAIGWSARPGAPAGAPRGPARAGRLRSRGRARPAGRPGLGRRGTAAADRGRRPGSCGRRGDEPARGGLVDDLRPYPPRCEQLTVHLRFVPFFRMVLRVMIESWPIVRY
jgi:hypothetical protein